MPVQYPCIKHGIVSAQRSLVPVYGLEEIIDRGLVSTAGDALLVIHLHGYADDLKHVTV